MSFIYPRVISITRPEAQTGVGFQTAYAADTKAQETQIASGLPASIQARSSTGKNPVALPADGKAQTWRIMIPKSVSVLGQIKNRDIVTDDLGNRFQITADYWNSLGYNLICERLEA